MDNAKSKRSHGQVQKAPKRLSAAERTLPMWAELDEPNHAAIDLADALGSRAVALSVGTDGTPPRGDGNGSPEDYSARAERVWKSDSPRRYTAAEVEQQMALPWRRPRHPFGELVELRRGLWQATCATCGLVRRVDTGRARLTVWLLADGREVTDPPSCNTVPGDREKVNDVHAALQGSE